MKAFLLTGPLVALTLMAATTPAATAASPVVAATASLGHHHYDVYYKTCFLGQWKLYGSYGCREEADAAACYLHDERGYRTKVRHHH